jgi:hypothetical protein
MLKWPTLNPFKSVMSLLMADAVKEIKTAIKESENRIMSALDDQITALTTEVENETNVEKSALTLIQGIGAQISAAVAAATAAGATPAQLAAIKAVQTTLAANDSELSAAVVANTPAA